MPHRYRAFGLTIESDMPCPELIAASTDAPPDVDVRLTRLDDARDHGGAVPDTGQVRLGTAPRRSQFAIRNVARYRVEAGRHILVDPAPNAAPGDVRLGLLGAALPVLINQRGLLTLHVSAVGLEDRAYAFCGQSGAGKSTLAAALSRHGLRLLTDDLGLALPDGDKVTLHPGFPHLRLWRDALQHLGLDQQSLIRDLTRPDKYQLDVDTGNGFCPEPLPLRRLYVLERGAGDEVCIEPVRGHAAIALIQAHTCLPGVNDRSAQADALLRHSSRIARRIQVYRFCRPWRLDRLDLGVQELLAHLFADAGRN